MAEVNFEQVAAFIASGDYDSATRLSGELLADCDNDLRQAYQQADVTDDHVTTFAQAALLHIHSLRLSSQPSEAFLCSIGVLLTIEIYNIASKTDVIDRMRLYFYAIQSAIDSFEAMKLSETAETEEHRGYILSYLASLLYYNYRLAASTDKESSALADAYQFLIAIKDSGAIQSPTIQFGEKALDPATESGPLLVDIMSRAAALGIS